MTFSEETDGLVLIENREKINGTPRSLSAALSPTEAVTEVLTSCCLV